MPVKELYQPGEISQRPRQPVNLVDNDDVDLVGFDPGPAAPSGRAAPARARQAPVVKWSRGPAASPHGPGSDIGLAGFALGVEGVEGEIEIMLGGFAGVDGAALGLWDRRLHAAPPHCFGRRSSRTDPGSRRLSSVPRRSRSSAARRVLAPRRPKKRGPFHFVPVILRAIADRLAKVCPCQQKPPGATMTS